jgi:oxygen-dependent protoporphyrinogen oxidase
MNRIVIIGGGIAGLSAAYYASKKLPGVHITVIESSDRWGGKITTDRASSEYGQFIIEGGADSFLTTKPHAATLCQELGISQRLQGANPHQKNTYILRHNKLEPLPDGFTMMIPTNVSAILKSRLVSWLGKVRMGLDFFLPAKSMSGDESLGMFISRRLGRETYENLIEPLMSGIYAGDGDQLSLASTFPGLRDLEIEYGSLVRGALQIRQQSTGKSVQGSRSAFVTPATGLAEIIESLVDHLQNADLRLNTSACRISNSNSGYHVELEDGSSIDSVSVILATPAHISGTLLGTLDPALASDLKSISHASTATISIAYRQSDLPDELDGYGYIIPRREGREALACTWTSTKFRHRAPEGCVLIRVFVGRAGQDIPWNENELLELAKKELRLTLGIKANPILSRVFIWDKAMPQYNVGHVKILNRIDAALKNHPGLVLAGSSYRGVGIPDCIHSGELAVNRIIENVSAGNSSMFLRTAL